MAAQEIIQVGQTVHVLVRSTFYGQRAKVLIVERDRGGKIWYRLAVTWEGTPRPSWFEASEVERVEE
jgi:hypothetical protein